MSVCYCEDHDETFDTDHDTDSHRYCKGFVDPSSDPEDYADWKAWRDEVDA